LNVFGNLIEIP